MSKNSPSSNNQIRPTKTAFEFFCEMIYDEEIKRNRDNGINDIVSKTDINQICQIKWPNLPDRDKQRFYDLESKDLERYQAEIGSYGHGRSVHPKSAFFIFSHDKRQSLHEKFPNYDEFQIAQECLKLWNKLSPTEKNVWEQQAYEGNF
uniref:HMG box domain-containing protein n=1 Tax=Panagrolaimus sp. PS1159 TaxID=55785 RepID=A0AC35GU69_9BILA